jgi:hypothetical protein
VLVQMRIRYYWNPTLGNFGDLEIFQVMGTARALALRHNP